MLCSTGFRCIGLLLDSQWGGKHDSDATEGSAAKPSLAKHCNAYKLHDVKNCMTCMTTIFDSSVNVMGCFL